MKAAIIGGGLAGCALAYVLKQAGAQPVIYEAGSDLAGAASGNAVGLYNPRLSAERAAESDFFTAAYALALRHFAQLGPAIEWQACGALHLMREEKRAKRFAQSAANWGWGETQMRVVEPAEAARIAGVEIAYPALYLAESGTVNPAQLCRAYAADIDVHCNAKITNIAEIKADAVVVASGRAALEFAELAHLPLKPVRGQITFVAANQNSEKLQCNLCYGGYLTPAKNGVHALGATFQRWLDHNEIIPEDDAENVQKLAEVAPQLAAGLKITGQRASVRMSAKDHFPVIGRINEKLFISAAHGSHGILSTLAGAHLLSDMILQRPRSLPGAVIKALDPHRWAQ